MEENASNLPALRTDKLEARVASLERQLGVAAGRSEAATPGGLHGYDTAVLSGIRRKPNRKADARRFAAYSREAELWGLLERARAELALRVRANQRALVEAGLKASVTEQAIASARFVRDGVGWHRVVRVSAKSVTVETGYSWTERILKGSILEVRGDVGVVS